jgi:hypothetical protein
MGDPNRSNRTVIDRDHLEERWCNASLLKFRSAARQHQTQAGI